MSPALLERYLSAAWKISALAVGNPQIAPSARTRFASAAICRRTSTSKACRSARAAACWSATLPARRRVRRQAEAAIGTTVNIIRGLEVAARARSHRSTASASSSTRFGGNERRAGQLPRTRPRPATSSKSAFSARAGQGRPARDRRRRSCRRARRRRVELLQPFHARARSTRSRRSASRSSTRSTIDRPVQRDRPGDTPSRRRIFICQAARTARSDERPARETILSTLARRAYRRPVTDAEIDAADRLLPARARERAALRRRHRARAARSCWSSPQFLFRVERDPAGVAGRRRLSRSATSSWRRGCRSSSGAAFPTTSCSTLARQGQAAGSGGARAAGHADAGRPDAPRRSVEQLRRAVAATCATCKSLRRIARCFPDFDDNLRQAMQRETELFFDSIMREDRSVARSADRRLHVRQRAAGAALRHPERLRQPVPPRRRSPTSRAAGCSARAAS